MQISTHNIARTATPMRQTLSAGTELIDRRLGSGQTQFYAAKQHLFCEGDDADEFFRIEAGHVCIYSVLPDGRRQVIEFAYPGDVIGLGTAGTHTLNAEAMSSTRVRSLPTASIEDAVRRDPQLGLKLYEAVSRQLGDARHRLMSMGRCDAAERLAGFLLALLRRGKDANATAKDLVLPMTRADIADYLGLTTETVSRTFTRFRQEGLITIDQGILIAIHDLPSLKLLAEGAHGKMRDMAA
jgi:CRP/FNR family transcriptional regulator